ncbi:MAG: cytochrome c oxidase subunit II [Ilumatobacter sp.]|nr:cytochrome c oxidase subunit II [Ilumatobacter sp.]
MQGSLVRGALDPRGSDAREIAALWWLLLALGAAVFAVVAVALFIGARRNSTTDASTARRWMLGGGIVLPSTVVAVVLGATLWAMRSTAEQPPAVEVEVIGHQWWWEVRYPDHGVVTANEIHIPAGEPVALRLQSADVIHSLWIPELAGKLDLLPERVNTLVIDASSPGEYAGRCAEFCGLQHANMDLVVVAHDAAGFTAWVAEQRTPAADPATAPAQRGLVTFLAHDCASCHTISGASAGGETGPDLTHLMGRSSIAGGLLDTTVPSLREWITDPHDVKPGVLMPAPALTDAEIDDLLAYLETLE